MTRLQRMWPLAAVFAFIAGTPTAMAYSDPSIFADPEVEGGGGGRWFTGSPNDGFTCESCHTDSFHPSFNLSVDGLPSLFEPNQEYTIEISWPKKFLGVSMVAEMVDDSGSSIGVLQGAEEIYDAVPAFPRRRIAGFSSDSPGPFTMTWTAPSKRIDEVTLYLAAVSGDDSQDPAGDLSTHFVSTVTRNGSTVSDSNSPDGLFGCSMTLASNPNNNGSTQPRTIGLAFLSLLALAASRIVKRRQVSLRRVTSALGLLFAVSLSAGCVTVKPYERARLAAPCMAMNPNADLTFGRSHATDYREGSQGGFGGGGGGCGCN